MLVSYKKILTGRRSRRLR